MHEAGLKEYTLYEHMLLFNEMVREFYTHLQPAVDNQPTFSIARGKEIPFIRSDILKAILIPNVPEKEPSFVDRVNKILSDSSRFRELCSNGFNKSFLKVGYQRRPFILVSRSIKYNIVSSTTTIELYSMTLYY